MEVLTAFIWWTVLIAVHGEGTFTVLLYQHCFKAFDLFLMVVCLRLEPLQCNVFVQEEMVDSLVYALAFSSYIYSNHLA